MIDLQYVHKCPRCNNLYSDERLWELITNMKTPDALIKEYKIDACPVCVVTKGIIKVVKSFQE